MGSRYPSRRRRNVARGKGNPRCSLISCNRGTANVFDYYAHGTFQVKSGGFIYGTVSPDGELDATFVYEPPQNCTQDELVLLRDEDEENLVEAMAEMFGVKKVGFIIRHAKRRDYAMSSEEIFQAAVMMDTSGVKDWVTVVVNLADGGANVRFEAFLMSDLFIELYRDGFFEQEDVDPKLLKMKMDLMVEGEAFREAETGFFLVPVKMFNHKKMEVGTSIKLIHSGLRESHLENPHLGPIQDLVNRLRARANEGPSRENPYSTTLMGPLEKLVHQLGVKVKDGLGKRNRSCTISDFMALDPPKFNGTTGPTQAHKWFKETGNMLELLGCCDDQKVLFATFMLKGDARLWWDMTKQHNQGVQMSWEKFRVVFNSRYFSSRAQFDLEMKFFYLKQDGMSVAEYESKFLELSFACPENYSDTIIGLKFFGGLNPEIQGRFLRLFYMDSDESYAGMVEKAYIAERDIQSTRDESYSSDGSGDLEDGAEFMKKARGKNGAVHGRDFRCYNCGKTGHRAKNCNGPTSCYKCGQEGHIAKYCTC